MEKLRAGAGALMKRAASFKNQIIILVAAALLALLSSRLSEGSGVLKDGAAIERSGPGGADREYGFVVGGLTDSQEKISIKVSHREYSEEEAYAMFDAVMEELAVHIVGSNQDLGVISTDLSFPSKIAGFDGIKLAWEPQDTALVGRDGKVNNFDLEEPVGTVLNVTLSTGSYSETYALGLTIVPAGYMPEEELKERFAAFLEEADEEQLENGVFELPLSFMGRKLTYSEEADNGWMQIIAAGIVAAVLVGLKPEQDRRKAQKERETELLIDYSEVVSKLMVYMGAGLTARNAFIKIASGYSAALSEGRSGRRAVYEEMLVTAGELNKGVPEGRAFGAFARRCGQKCYLKLVSILEQARRTGDPRMYDSMRLEIQEAFEQRKNMARRLGEEAGTKLMLPLVMSLITVFIIVAVPALMTLG